MPKYKVTLQKSMYAGVGELASMIGIDQEFFTRLVNEDDWSFIIKLHALFEAVCTHLLMFHFREEKLSRVISRLELSNKSTGKIVFLKELELLGERDRRFISSLSELRNKLVHDVRNCTFSLDTLVAGLSDKDLKRFTKNFSPYEVITVHDTKKGGQLPGLVEIDENAMRELMNRAKEAPKLHIWVGAQNVLTTIGDMHGFSEYKQWKKAKKLLFEDDEEED